MTEEEYFRKTYPDYCYGDRLLSPYWDLFQDGIEYGERQSEKRIEELEKQIEEMKCCENCRWLWLKTYNETVTACSSCKDKNMWRLKKWVE